MKRLLFMFLLCGGLLFSQSVKSATFNVTDSASFQVALTTAQDNDSTNTINLAQGTYTGPFTYIANSGKSGDSLTIIGESNANTFITNPGNTALSIQGATINVSGITFMDFEFALEIDDAVFGDPFGALNLTVTDCIFQGTGQDEGTSELAVDIEYLNEKMDNGSVTISGNTFENIGNSSTYYGAGVHIETPSSTSTPLSVITISDNIFTANYSNEWGGGLYIELGNNANTPVNITGNQFNTNISEYEGGGAYIVLESNASNIPITVSDNTFNGNQADSYAGGIYIETNSDGSSITLTGNTFNANTSGSGGGGAYFDVRGENSTLTIGGDEDDANTFTQNSGGNGSAFYVSSNTATVDITITSNMIGGTQASNGNGDISTGRGAVYASFLGDLTFHNNQVLNNQARRYAAAYFVVSADNTNTATVNISNNEFTANTGDITGGGLGVSLACACSFTLNSNLISGNQAQEVGGAYITLSSGNMANDAYIMNNIIVNNQGTGSGYNGGGLNLTASDYDSVLVINNTIAANSTTLDGGGAYFNIGVLDSQLGNYNNIYWGNTAGQNGQDVYLVNNPGSFAYNDVTNLCTDTGSVACATCSNDTNECDVSALTLGQNDHNVGANPAFQTGSGNTAAAYNLLETSPVISLGTDLSAVNALLSYDYDQEHPRPTPGSNFVAMGAIQYASNPILSVSPASKDYGDVSVGSSTTQTFVLSNIGNATLTVSSIALSDTTNFTLNVSPSSNPCGATPAVSPNGSCNVEVTFNPAAAQTISANLLISSDAADSPASVDLSGSASDSSCTPIFDIDITAPSGEIEVGDNITWVVTMSNTAACDSENTTFSAELSANQEAQSGSSANSSLSAIRSSIASTTCSVSGVNVSCALGIFAANSSMTFNITSKVTAAGILNITGSLTNQAGTATASALATATAVTPGLLSGEGCSLNKSETSSLRNLWVYGLVMLLPLLRLSKQMRKRR